MDVAELDAIRADRDAWRARAEAAEAKIAEWDEYRRKRNCMSTDGTPKRPFASRWDAEIELKALRARDGAEDRRETYRCNTCGNWHLGKTGYDELTDEVLMLRKRIAELEAGKR